MSKRTGVNVAGPAWFRGSRISSMRRGANLLVAALTALLSVSFIGFIGVGAASASISVATGAPVAGSVLVADANTNAVYSFLPNSPNELTVGSVNQGVSEPESVAVDSAGDTYIANEGTSSIDEFSTFGVESTVNANFCSGCAFVPTGVAVDGAGDLFVADNGDGAVDEVPANSSNVITIATNFTPYGIASDTSGDVFVADQTDNQIIEIQAGTETPSVYANLPFQPDGVAVDSNGNLFVTMPSARDIVEIPKSAPSTEISVATGVYAVSVAVDQSGDVYYPDLLTAGAWESKWTGSKFAAATEIQSGFSDPVGIAVYPPAAFSPTIVANITATEVYGGALTYTTTITPSSAASEVSGTPSCVTLYSSEGAPSPVGSDQFINCTGLKASSGNQLSYELGNVTVTPASLTISPATTSMTYGTVPTITAQYSGLQGTDTAASFTTPPTCTTNATATAGIGSVFSTSCSGAVDPNYTISYSPGTITVAAATLSVTAPSFTITYGTATPTLTAAVTGLKNGDTLIGLGLVTPCTTTASAIPTVDTYPITCTGLLSVGNYLVNYIAGSLTVNPKQLTISASSSSVLYGAAVPTVSPSYSGWVNGDTPTKAGFSPATCSTTYTATSSVGSYATTCSGAVAPNYSITYVPGAVSVGPNVLSIAASSGSMTYGGTTPLITPSYSGWVGNDGPSSLTTLPTCTPGVTSSSAAGTYASTCSGAKDPNYTISYVNGSVTVAPAALTVTASSPTMTYGATPPPITPSYSGWVGNDGPSSLTTLPTCSTTATATSPVGSYTSSCNGAKDSNYTITYVNGSVKVSSATLTITASSSSVLYGSGVPTITASYTGSTDGTPPASLTTAPTCTTTETKSSSIGTYASSCRGAVDPDYTIVYVPGIVTVTTAPLTVTASSADIALGATPPAITASYATFVNGDTAASLTKQPTCSTTASKTSAAGTYPSACSGAVDANYSIVYVAGTVHIGQVVLTVDAPNVTSLFGHSIPALAATITGFPAGVTLANSGITGAPICTTVATASSPAGSYPVTCTAGTLASQTYSFSFAPGLLTVGFSQTCITGFYFGAITVKSGQAICIGQQAEVLGVINVQAGGSLDVEGSTVVGAVAASKAAAIRICSSSIGAAVSVNGTTGLVTIGDPNSSCGGDSFVGSLSVTGNTGGVEFVGNSVLGGFLMTNNSGSLAAPESGSTYIANNKIM